MVFVSDRRRGNVSCRSDLTAGRSRIVASAVLSSTLYNNYKFDSTTDLSWRALAAERYAMRRLTGAF